MSDDRPSQKRKKKNALKLDEQDALLWKYVKKSVTPIENANDFEPFGDLEANFSDMIETDKQKKSQSISKDELPAEGAQRKPKTEMPSYTPPVSIPKNQGRARNRPTPDLADFQRREVRTHRNGTFAH